LLKRKAVRCRSLVLTFDDGPGSRLTPAILNILADNNVKASFFLLGRNIKGREQLVRRIAVAGHEICSHGQDHANYWFVSPFRSLADIKEGWQAIDAALGEAKGKYPFRPPHGKLNLICLLYLLLRQVPIVYWSIVAGDTWPVEKRDAHRASILIEKTGGGVMLAHDFDRADSSGDDMILETVRAALAAARDNGIGIKTATELFNYSE